VTPAKKLSPGQPDRRRIRETMPVCPKCREKNPKLGAKCPRDGFYFIEEAALRDAEEDPRIGKLTADKFVIVDLISEGGMGAVYKAMQLPVEREVALKVLRAELEDSNQGRDRFVREARAVSKLTHPNVITLHDFGFEDSGHPYMVMEYAPGVSLAGWLRRDDLTVERIIHVLQQILSALSEAHERGIVHRDLKPENLIVTKTGNDDDYIKLLDFGIARLVNEGATKGLTKEGEVFGTPHYMSPEQAQGKTDIGPQADVYALGVMAFELFSGNPPFDASTPLSVLYMHINDDLPQLRPRAGLSPPDSVLEVIRKSTRKDPDDRYATAGEMLAALNAGLQRDGMSENVAYSAGASHSGQFPVKASHESPDEEDSTHGHNGEEAPSAHDEAKRRTELLGGQVAQQDPADAVDQPGSAEGKDDAPEAFTEESNAPPTLAHLPEDQATDTDTDTDTTDVGATLVSVDDGRRRTILVAVALIACVILIGGVSAYMLSGDDGTENAGGETGALQKSTAGADKAQMQDPEEAAADQQQDPTQEAGETAEGSDEQAVAESGDEQAGDQEAMRVDEREDDNTAPDEARDEPTESAAAADKREASAPREQADETKKTDEKPVDDEPSERASESQPDDEPEKFEPTKFRPVDKSDDEESDDDPEKFEPAKWR
jgi:serine/threonine protein kinase